MPVLLLVECRYLGVSAYLGAEDEGALGVEDEGALGVSHKLLSGCSTKIFSSSDRASGR